MSDREDIYRIPKRINEPIMFTYWPFQHFVIVLVALGLGMVIGMALEMFVVSVVFLKVSSYLAELYPRSRLRHLLWYHGWLPVGEKHKTTPDPTKREWFK